MVSLHLKRVSMPTSWPIKRKNIQFISKPNAGSYKRDYVVSVLILLRDIMGVAKSLKEARYIVNNEEVLVNGVKATNVKVPVGLFDIVEIPKEGKKFTVLFNEVGRLKLVDVKDNYVYERVSGKAVTKGSKFQVNFLSGHNLIVDEKTFSQVKVSDSVVYDYAKKKIASILPLKEGSFAYIFDGNSRGKLGKINSIVNFNGLAKDTAEVESEGVVFRTAKDYCFVVGTKKEDLKRFD